MKKYEIEWDEKGMTMKRTNDGFSTIELVGLLELTLQDIKHQMVHRDINVERIIKNQDGEDITNRR